MEDHNEIQEIMSRSYGMDDVDEDDLAAGMLQGGCPSRGIFTHNPASPTEFDALDMELGDESLSFLDDAASVPAGLPSTSWREAHSTSIAHLPPFHLPSPLLPLSRACGRNAGCQACGGCARRRVWPAPSQLSVFSFPLLR